MNFAHDEPLGKINTDIDLTPIVSQERDQETMVFLDARQQWQERQFKNNMKPRSKSKKSEEKSIARRRKSEIHHKPTKILVRVVDQVKPAQRN